MNLENKYHIPDKVREMIEERRYGATSMFLRDDVEEIISFAIAEYEKSLWRSPDTKPLTQVMVSDEVLIKDKKGDYSIGWYSFSEGYWEDSEREDIDVIAWRELPKYEG